MIRIAITTDPSWTPIAHSYLHPDPSYVQRTKHAQITSRLGIELRTALDANWDIIGRHEMINVRYFEASPSDTEVPQIEVFIEFTQDLGTDLNPTLDMPVIIDFCTAATSKILQRHLREVSPVQTPSVVVHVSHAPTSSVRILLQTAPES